MPFVPSHFRGAFLEAAQLVKKREKINRNNRLIAFFFFVFII